jgi:NRPS condensation-like uncharacterized protein
MDFLTKFILNIEDIFNLNTCQIVVVKGRLDPDLVERAIRKTVSDFPLLLSGLDKKSKKIIDGFWRPEHIFLKRIAFDGDYTFHNPDFRQILMKTLQENPVVWKLQPPIKFYFFESGSVNRTALMFNTNHAVADAKSDFLLLEKTMKQYGELLSVDRFPGHSTQPYSYTDFDAVLKTHPLRKKGLVSLKNHLDQLIYDKSVRYFPMRNPTGKAKKNLNEHIDFHHEPLNADDDRLIREVAEISCQTINTVIFAGLYRALQMRDKSQNKKMRIVFTISLRSYLEPAHRENFQNLMITAGMNFDSDYQNTEDLLNDICRRVQSLRSGKIFTLCEAWKFMNPILRFPLFKFVRPKILRSMAGTNVCYSNPGRITEKLTEFGSSNFPVLEHTGYGCLVPPYDFIIYSPELNGRLFLNAIYRSDVIKDIRSEIIEPLKSAIEQMSQGLSKKHN